MASAPDAPPTQPTLHWDLVGLGACTLDLLMLVPDFPSDESVQRSSQTLLQGGGPVATALTAAARLGARTIMIDRFGDDWIGQRIRSELEQFGVDTTHCATQPGAASPMASIWVRERDGARTIAYDPGTIAPMMPTDLPPGVIESARVLHTNGRHASAWFEAAKRARAAGATVSFDGGAHRFQPENRSFLPWIDLAILSLDWAQQCSGFSDPLQAAQTVRDQGPGTVVVTAGTRGSWILSAADSFHQPAFLLPDTVDTTGCGDVYHGAFLAGWTRGLLLRECALMASAAAAINSLALGGRGNLPSLPQLQEFLETTPTRSGTEQSL